jgi:hypothetical protein
VEVVSSSERNGTKYYKMRDLRNGNLVKNVTHSSARRLWHYAILEYDKLPKDRSKAGIQWQGDLGMVKHHKQGKIDRYDLAQRMPDGQYRFYYGVTEDGITGAWKELIGDDTTND